MLSSTDSGVQIKNSRSAFAVSSGFSSGMKFPACTGVPADRAAALGLPQRQWLEQPVDRPAGAPRGRHGHHMRLPKAVQQQRRAQRLAQHPL